MMCGGAGRPDCRTVIEIRESGRLVAVAKTSGGRERAIANLVAQGHTNHMIAAHAVPLTEDDRESPHNVFAKLSVASRSQVAELLGRSRPHARLTRSVHPRAPGCTGGSPMVCHRAARHREQHGTRATCCLTRPPRLAGRSR
jgi:hypothetical protein